VIAGVAVFGAFYWAQSLPAEIPSEVRTGSLWVRVTTAKTTYTAGETVRLNLSITNLGAQPLRLPTRIDIYRMNATEELRYYVTVTTLYAQGKETIRPQEEYCDVIDIAASPDRMPPDRYTFVIVIPQYDTSLATHITVT
jgi:hypothetical protein